MATGTRDELDKLAMNNKSQVKRTTCDICRERKVRCDRNKPECLRCRRSGYKCTYPSENSNAAKLTEALQELNNRPRHAETMIQTSTILKEDNPRRDSPQAHAPQASTDFTSLLDSIEFAQTIQDDQLFSWEKLAASDFDAVFSHSEDATQWPEMKKNEFTSSKELCEIDQMEDISCGGGFDPSNGSANPSSRPSPNIIENIQLHDKTCEDLFKKYFGVIQKHFPLVDQDKFMQSTVLSNASQAQALKYAICMAGAHINKDSHREKQFYVAARYHLEQAELEVQGSLFWSLEAAQALVLVARYELTHINSPRALISISRLDRLVSILQRRLDNPTSDQALLQVPRLDSSSHFEMRRTFFLALSLKYRNLTAAQIHDDAESHFACMQPPRLSTAYTLPGPLSVFDRISPSKVETLDSFSIFMVCWRITSDADSHRRETAVDAAGPTVEYNYCHVHDRIDQEIGIIVSYLASSHLSTESLDNELLVLAMIIILGARIQLFNTAILHSSMAGFLKPAIDECLQQNISTAKDISDIILQAQMLDTSRVAIYREASFYIMPPLALAAEAHMRLAKAKASKINGAGSGNTQHYLSPETRESLGVLYMAMEACKDETGRYTDLLSECQGFLGASGSGKRLRTEFTNLGRRAASSSE